MSIEEQLQEIIEDCRRGVLMCAADARRAKNIRRILVGTLTVLYLPCLEYAYESRWTHYFINVALYTMSVAFQHIIWGIRIRRARKDKIWFADRICEAQAFLEAWRGYKDQGE
jgi:hypothetical protein